MAEPMPEPPPAPDPSRRDFLTRTAALAGAAPWLGACQWLGGERALPRASTRGRPAADEPLRIGVIGTGGMGTSHCGSLLALARAGAEKLEIVALSDVCRKRLDEARASCEEKQGKAVATHGEYADLLARDDLHGVLIASPEHWHAKMAEDAIAAGLDVYLEKPMTLRLREALRLLAIARANPHMIVQVGTQFVTHQKYHEARRLIAEGVIGEPTCSQTSYCRNSKVGEWLYAIDAEWQPGVNIDWERWCGPLGAQAWDPALYARWRRYRRFSTGIVGDLLVHVMTPLMFAVDRGWPTRVVACGGHYCDKAMENHDQVNVVVQFEREHTMTLTGSTCNERGDEIMIRGHRATLFLGGKDCAIRPERIYAEEIDEQVIQCQPTADDQDRLRLDWLASMRTRRPNLSPVELGAKVMVIVDLATRSMWEGSAFAFDPSTMTARAV